MWFSDEIAPLLSQTTCTAPVPSVSTTCALMPSYSACSIAMASAFVQDKSPSSRPRNSSGCKGIDAFHVVPLMCAPVADSLVSTTKVVAALIGASHGLPTILRTSWSRNSVKLLFNALSFAASVSSSQSLSRVNARIIKGLNGKASAAAANWPTTLRYCLGVPPAHFLQARLLSAPTFSPVV